MHVIILLFHRSNKVTKIHMCYSNIIQLEFAKLGKPEKINPKWQQATGIPIGLRNSTVRFTGLQCAPSHTITTGAPMPSTSVSPRILIRHSCFSFCRWVWYAFFSTALR